MVGKEGVGDSLVCSNLVPQTSTYCPGIKCEAVTFVPTGNTASSVILNSASLRFGTMPAFWNCPITAFDIFTV